MRKFYYYLHVPILVLIGISSIFYFSFTAEDAYITYRYAENWINTGSLVYNLGEPINAMTSPLHAVLSAAMFYLTGHTVLANKVLSVLLLLLAALAVWYRYRGQPHLQVLALILLAPPCVLLWTFGGLETLTLLFLATVTVILVLRPLPFSLKSLCVVFLLAGLAFLTRYDSILFFLPVSLYVAKKASSLKHLLIAVTSAIILPLGWLFVSLNYYGDLLPTSFYVKTPHGGLGWLILNGKYIASYLLFVGIIPVIALVFVLLVARRRTIETLYQHLKGIWWLYLGLLLEILYGLTMATEHMMFSFRFFVPYLPSAVILIVDLLRRASGTGEWLLSAGRPAYAFTAFVLFLASFQLYQNVYTYKYSVNGLSSIGEYRALGIRDYVSFMRILKQEALDIEHDWKVTRRNGGSPRILTFAGGMLPYTYKDSYIYEQLVSYRHCQQRYRQGLHADYLHILAPRQGQIDQQLPRPADSYVLVSSYQMIFDGSMQKFLVYYNPWPEPQNLSTRIYDPCMQGESAAN